MELCGYITKLFADDVFLQLQRGDTNVEEALANSKEITGKIGLDLKTEKCKNTRDHPIITFVGFEFDA